MPKRNTPPRALRDDELDKVRGGSHEICGDPEGEVLIEGDSSGPGPIAEVADVDPTVGDDDKPGNLDRN